MRVLEYFSLYLCPFLKVVFLTELVLFILVIKFIGIKLFIVLIIQLIYVKSTVILPVSFLILVNRCLSILANLCENILILFFFPLFFRYAGFCSFLYFFRFSLLFFYLLGSISSQIWAFKSITFSHSTALAKCHKFWYIVFLF